MGCDTVDTREPEPETQVFSFEVDFVLDDVDFQGQVAAISYDAPEFTQDVVNEGAVLAYFRDLENTWTAMPFTYGIEAEDLPAVDYTATLAYAYERNRLDVFVEASSTHEEVHDAIRDSELFIGVLPIKIVVIRGGQQFRSEVDVRSYEAVKSYFNLGD